jgi:hypothetical protein
MNGDFSRPRGWRDRQSPQEKPLDCGDLELSVETLTNINFFAVAGGRNSTNMGVIPLLCASGGNAKGLVLDTMAVCPVFSFGDETSIWALGSCANSERNFRR